MLQQLRPFFCLALFFGAVPLVAGIDALDEVNTYRAQRGLPPFTRDPQLTQAASAAADSRAARLLAGHTESDFNFLPLGASADAAGCAAWTPDWGWGSCCSDERYPYAGAAYAWGSDGKRYMHLFVSKTLNAATVAAPASQPQSSWMRVEAGWWLKSGENYVGFLRDDRTFYWRSADGKFSAGQKLDPGQSPR